VVPLDQTREEQQFYAKQKQRKETYITYITDKISEAIKGR
jgi:hypothetical protein